MSESGGEERRRMKKGGKARTYDNDSGSHCSDVPKGAFALVVKLIGKNYRRGGFIGAYMLVVWWWFCGGFVVVLWWFVDGLVVVWWWFTGGLLMVWWWFVGGLVMVFWWFNGGLFVACWWFVGGLLVVCWWFVGGRYERVVAIKADNSISIYSLNIKISIKFISN